jgi:transposase
VEQAIGIQAALMLHAGRDLLLRQRTMLVNTIRGHSAEFGVCAALGVGKVEELLKQVAEEQSLPALARDLVALPGRQLDGLQEQIEAIERRLLAWHRRCALSRRLAAIPGIGPITATALVMKAPDPHMFKLANPCWQGPSTYGPRLGGRGDRRCRVGVGVRRGRACQPPLRCVHAVGTSRGVTQ